MAKLVTASKDNVWISKLENSLLEAWKNLETDFSDISHVDSIETFASYYQCVKDWWSAMKLFFYMANLEEVPSDVRLMSMRYRTRAEKLSDKFDDNFLAIWKQIKPSMSNMAMMFLPSEAFQSGDGEAPYETLEALRSRNDGFAFLDGEIVPYALLPERLKSLGYALKDQSDFMGLKEFRGAIASGGLARGKVRIVLLKKDTALVESGEVLISAMTTPDYLLAMKKAAAFVTDEGGIACHAAIVARELQKPCIIGTKIATKVLHDGDEVEVDADNGVVRIIKRAV